MRVLHLVKTSDGASWAANQAAELVKLGVEVHVALPRESGRAVQKWVDGGAIIHVAPMDLPVSFPWEMSGRMSAVRRLIVSVQPDLIHSHFFGSTLLIRLALGANSPIPRLFQVPGPLHLEHRMWRALELSTAGRRDYWIASSRCILNHYKAAGVADDRLYLSYYGIPTDSYPASRDGLLRKRFNISHHAIIVGNANFMYPPKWYLGQSIGIKAHEDIIDALGLVIKQRPDVVGVLIGGSAVTASGSYERRLRRRALAVGGGQILMTGYLPVEDIRLMWADFDVAVHVPISENCGGIGEPMLAGVPVIAGRVGGLPEAVIEDVTGSLVAIRQPHELARSILRVLEFPDYYRSLAKCGQVLVRRMVSMERIGREVLSIYSHVLGHEVVRPQYFDPSATLTKPSSTLNVMSNVPRGQ